MNPRMRRLLAALGAALALPAGAGSFIANNAEVSTGGTLALLLDPGAAREDATYLAAVVGDTIYFVDEAGALRAYTPGAVTPKRQQGARAGWQTLLSYAPPYGVDLPVAFYTASGRAGVDVLGTPGALDPASIRRVDVRFRSRAINNERWGDGPNGGALYNTNCAGCHDADPIMNRNRINNGQQGAAIRNAIASNLGGMGYLGFLTAAESDAIAAWIKEPTFDCH